MKGKRRMQQAFDGVVVTCTCDNAIANGDTRVLHLVYYHEDDEWHWHDLSAEKKKNYVAWQWASCE